MTARHILPPGTDMPVIDKGKAAGQEGLFGIAGGSLPGSARVIRLLA